jgi:hypothetical protein
MPGRSRFHDPRYRLHTVVPTTMSTRYLGSWDPRSAVSVVHCCGRSHGQPIRRILVAWTSRVGRRASAMPTSCSPPGAHDRVRGARRTPAPRPAGLSPPSWVSTRGQGCAGCTPRCCARPASWLRDRSSAPDSVASRPNRCAAAVVAVGPAPAASRCATSERNGHDTSRNRHSLGCCSPHRPPPGPRRKPETRRPERRALLGRALPGEQRRRWLPDCTRRSPLAALTGAPVP